MVDLDGRFTLSESPGLIGGAVASALESGTRKILLNLARVTYLDSAAGLGELVSSYTRAVRGGACLKLVHADKNISRVLHLTRLDNVFELFEDEASAISSFRG